MSSFLFRLSDEDTPEATAIYLRLPTKIEGGTKINFGAAFLPVSLAHRIQGVEITASTVNSSLY
jgi:hypothetical protein